ncbi:MAG: protein-S-isoprenylcysteine O-methyltransferase [Cyanobacteria bacterium J06635_15]
MRHPFVFIYLIGVLVAWVTRIVQTKDHHKVRTTRILWPELSLMVLWFIASQVLPLIYYFTPIFKFANYSMPNFVSVIGVGVFGLAIWLLWRSHVDLGQNWSPIAEIQTQQVLVTQGVYRYLRHPMYSAHILWGVAQGMLIANWLVGSGGIITFTLLYWVRVPKEEALMQARFGQHYASYKQTTGAVIPKLL